MLKSIYIKNFKAIRNSKAIKLTPLTVFIGNNGSGKSSVIEALETYKIIVESGLDEAMSIWRGFEHIRNQAVPHQIRQLNGNKPTETNPIEFNLVWKNYRATMTIGAGAGGNQIFIQDEKLTVKNTPIDQPLRENLTDDQSCINTTLDHQFNIDLYANISHWQFLNLNPYLMGEPKLQKRTGGYIPLAKDGSNLAEYLLTIYNQDKAAFNGILETLQYVLPYAEDLQTKITSELERSVYLQLTESNFKVPGWLLSTGTLRILALLAVLRHPNPPPLILIEEIENGLDPRTIHLIVEEIRNVIETGKSQIIITTHSPYFLDLLTLSHLILVERDSTGQPVFVRPANQTSLQDWSQKFSPGKLYTMGRFAQEVTA
jgi:predicted ATPase